MKHLLLGLTFGLCSTALFAQDTLAGQFGHAFVKKPNEVVWTIQPKANTYELIMHGDNSTTQLHKLSDKERSTFWKKMDWPPASQQGADCAGNDEDLFCFVPPKQRAAITWLKDNQSGYFFYSQMGGVMEIKRISK
ncbi:hypothetical protein [Chitinivorax sp. B]|uniref:hypothetical protein n=1 Tax=Chitinivorax sp. B TaxID=2502235 RepID=UPI0010F58E50|nr:hypothetical protein [Chitinivorax sp. B]